MSRREVRNAMKGALLASSTTEADERRAKRIAEVRQSRRRQRKDVSTILTIEQSAAASKRSRHRSSSSSSSSDGGGGGGSSSSSRSGGSSSGSSSIDSSKKLKRHKKRKREKKERKRKKKEQRRRKKLKRAAQRTDNASVVEHKKAFAGLLHQIRQGQREGVEAVLMAHPDLVHDRVPIICLAGDDRSTSQSSWSVVHEAVNLCPVTGGRHGGTALARYAETAASSVLAALLRHCQAIGADANKLVLETKADETITAASGDGGRENDANTVVDNAYNHAVDNDNRLGLLINEHPTTEPSLPRVGTIVQAVYSRRWQPATVVSISDAVARTIDVTFFGYHDVISLPPERWASGSSVGVYQGAGRAARGESNRGHGAGPQRGGESTPLPRAHESPLHLACWCGSRPAVEMLRLAGASLLAVDEASGLLPIHVACDRHAPSYPRNGGDAEFVPWLLGRMAADVEGDGEGAEEVAAKLSSEAPPAFWRRGCDPLPLGLEEPPPDQWPAGDATVEAGVENSETVAEPDVGDIEEEAAPAMSAGSKAVPVACSAWHVLEEVDYGDDDD